MTKHAMLVGLVLLCARSASGEPADTLLINGKIFTSRASKPWVQALAIRGERIVAAGTTEEIRPLAGPGTRTIDLGGRTVISGFNDAHRHLEVTPPGMVEVKTEALDPSWTELSSALRAAAARATKDALLEAKIGYAVFADTRVDRRALDGISTAHPILVWTLTGHAVILNSAALARLRIDEKQPDPVGGRFERTPDGRLSGLVREYAAFQVARRLADLASDDEAVHQLGGALSKAVRWGVTTIQDMSGAIEPGRCARLLARIPPPLRIRIIPMPGTTPTGRDKDEGSGLATHPSARLAINGRKWLLDGVPLEYTLDPRDAHPRVGAPPFDATFAQLPLLFPEAEMEAMLRESLALDQQLMVHVSGYPSARKMLQAMQRTGGSEVWSRRRVRFEHGDSLFPDLFEQARALGVVVVQNPSHLNFFDPGALQKAQPLRSLLRAGIPVALGSDGPSNPFLNLMLAIVDKSRPSEAMSREEAVIALTGTAAYAEFTEGDKGTLEPGRLADLAVLSQDLFSVPIPDLPRTESVLTLVGGQVVYDAGVLQASRSR